MKKNQFLALAVFVFSAHFYMYYYMRTSFQECLLQPESDKLIKRLSYLLNEAVHKNSQLRCLIGAKRHLKQTLLCEKSPVSSLFDRSLALTISNVLENKCVASMGAGSGLYRKIIIELEQVTCYDAFEAAPFVNETGVEYLDMRVPVYHLKSYEWIVSLEVAAHIPVEQEAVFVENLARHASEGLIVSWSRTGPEVSYDSRGGGWRDLKFVKRELEKRGFIHDAGMSKVLQRAASIDVLKSNINAFYRI